MEEKIIEMFFCSQAGKRGGIGEKGRMHGRNIFVLYAGRRKAGVAPEEHGEKTEQPALQREK